MSEQVEPNERVNGWPIGRGECAECDNKRMVIHVGAVWLCEWCLQYAREALLDRMAKP